MQTIQDSRYDPAPRPCLTIRPSVRYPPPPPLARDCLSHTPNLSPHIPLLCLTIRPSVRPLPPPPPAPATAGLPFPNPSPLTPVVLAPTTRTSPMRRWQSSRCGSTGACHTPILPNAWGCPPRRSGGVFGESRKKCRGDVGKRPISVLTIGEDSISSIRQGRGMWGVGCGDGPRRRR